MTPLVREGSVSFLSHLKKPLHASVKHQKIKQNQANIFLNTNPQSPELEIIILSEVSQKEKTNTI